MSTPVPPVRYPLFPWIIALLFAAAVSVTLVSSRHRHSEEKPSHSPDFPDTLLVLPCDLDIKRSPDLAPVPRRLHDSIAACPEAQEFLRLNHDVMLIRPSPEKPWRVWVSRPWKPRREVAAKPE